MKVWYLGSSFFCHFIGKDLTTQFEEVTNKLAPEKPTKFLWMDLNLKFHGEVEAKGIKSFYDSFIDMGTCSLHSVHGAVKSGVESTSWGIKDILKVGFNLFHDSPACGEDFKVLTKNQMCTHCIFVPFNGWKMNVLQIGL